MLINSSTQKNSFKSHTITRARARARVYMHIRGCNQKFSDWPPGARTASGTALCHLVQLYHYFVSQSSEFCCHNPLYCFSMSNTKGKRIFRYRLSPETFGYTLVRACVRMCVCKLSIPLLTLCYAFNLHCCNRKCRTVIKCFRTHN
jgi:hypothetical protein